MQKILYSVVALLLATSVWAARICQEDAALVADHFMNGATTTSTLKKSFAPRMVRKATAPEDMYFLYENANGEGWVIISANDAVTPVLAYSDKGAFRTENQPANLREWMGKYNRLIAAVEADGLEASEEIQAEWEALRGNVRKAKGDAVVSPLIQTTWDQDAPYNTLCPGTGTFGEYSNKAATGCVATAMAQVMNYWQWPLQGTGSHTYQPELDLFDEEGEYTETIIYYQGNLTANFANTTYDWDNMLNSYSGSYSNAQKNAVATLMYHCGVAVNMQYGDYEHDGSGAYTVNYNYAWSTDSMPCAQNALVEFFDYKRDSIVAYGLDDPYGYYPKWSEADWKAMLRRELDKSRPIIYAGGAHCFVCDGYDDSDFFHFNWGWSGSCDGYYQITYLVPSETGGIGGGNYNFTEDQVVIIGIVPNREETPVEPVDVIWSVEGQTTTTQVTPGQKATAPVTPADCNCGKKFMGWTEQSSILNGAEPADLFESSKVVNESTTFYAVFAEQDGEGTAEVNDVLTVTTTGATGATYTDWSNKTLKSSAVYAGQSAGDKNSIQLRSKNSNSGVITTASGGKLSKVTVNWHSDTDAGRTLDVYGKNSAYSSPSDLYGNSSSTKGTKLGSIVKGTSTELVIDGDYTFIGVRSNNGALYMSSLTFTWGGGISYTNYALTCDCSPSAIESTKAAVKAMKILENGQIIMVRGNEKYTIFGQKIQ